MTDSCAPVGKLGIGAIRGDAGDAALRLPEQSRRLRYITGILAGEHVRDDLATAGVDREVQLAPSPTRATVLLGIPLPFTAYVGISTA